MTGGRGGGGIIGECESPISASSLLGQKSCFTALFYTVCYLYFASNKPFTVKRLTVAT